MRIDYDKVSGALYIKIREGKYSHTEDFSEKADVYLDVDIDGNVLGLEALSFDDLAQATEEHGGKLDIPEKMSRLPSLSKAASRLTKLQYRVLELMMIGVPVETIAEQIGVSTSTAKRILKEANRVLVESRPENKAPR